MFLGQEVKKISVDESQSIPRIVRLVENPDSPFSLPGKIYLCDHDRLHIILNRDLSLAGEACIVGFCMGNDPNTNLLHLILFKILSCHLYPKEYKFSKQELVDFKAGFVYGRSRKVKRINTLNLKEYDWCKVSDIQAHFDTYPDELNSIRYEIEFKKSAAVKNSKKWGEILRWSSSLCGILGGFILALNLSVSAYGFILLSLSSFQLLLSSCIKRDKSLIFYAGAIFVFVDLLGIYRWIVAT